MKSYKFRSGTAEKFQRDLECLKNNSTWFSKLDSLNDPLEGTIDHESLRNQVADLHKKYKRKNSKLGNKELLDLYVALDNILNQRNKVGILSLSKTNNNEALWTYYADEHRGFCIEYNFDILKADSNRSEINYVHVKYSNSVPKLEVSDLQKLTLGKKIHVIQKLLGTKSSRWSHEEEIRLISNLAGNNFHAPAAITAIYFGYNMSESNKADIISTLNGRNVQFFQMELDTVNYGLKAIPRY